MQNTNEFASEFAGEIAGKSVLITGASRGIGEAAARLFAKLGAHVVLTARTEAALQSIADEISAAGGSATALACDVATYQDVEKAVRASTEVTGKIDFLINNAGLIDPIARITDSDVDEWNKVIDINLKGVFHGMRAALPLMEKQKHGVIVNISSGAAAGALEGWSHYCSSKAAVLSLTKCGDKEMHEHGIRVVGLSPGTVATQMQIDIKASGINPVSQLDPSVHISPEAAAKAIVYLCTDAASDLHGVDFSIKTDEGRARVGL